MKNNNLILDIKTNKNCPHCRIPLLSAVFNRVEIDYCPKCYGLWFEEDELRLAKDGRDKSLIWLDIDLWQDEKKFKVNKGIRICPCCRVPLYEVYYGNSGVIVDVCNLCKGVWLDRAEFKKIINWLKQEAKYLVFNNYIKSLSKEAFEILIGPEAVKEEIFDFLAILKLLNYKFAVKFPALSKFMLRMPR